MGRYRPLNLAQMRSVAKKKDGECLSSKYVGVRAKYKFKCKNHHIWWVRGDAVLRGQWCYKCALEIMSQNLKGKKRGFKYTVLDLNELAKSRNGKCLSTKFLGAHNYYIWECKNGHTWEAVFTSIKRGSWCPQCSSSLSERLCRVIFEQTLGKKFPKTKPSWLINPKTGRRLELDGYNEELKLAFEYNGSQHYKLPAFYGNSDQFLDLKERDTLKAKICKINNIQLIVIPTISKDKLSSYIMNNLKMLGFDLAKNSKELDISNAYSDVSVVEKAKEYINSCGGELVNTLPLLEKITVKCKDGHVWITSTRHLYGNKTWCPYCSHTVRKTLKWARTLAEEKGGKCLSLEYKNTKTKMLWSCEFGHIWNTTSSSIASGSWCRICYYNSLRK